MSGECAAGQLCSFQLEKEFSYVLLGMTLAGAALFLFSRTLSTSQPFRLSAGTLGFMALSLAILLVLVSRFAIGTKASTDSGWKSLCHETLIRANSPCLAVLV